MVLEGGHESFPLKRLRPEFENQVPHVGERSLSQVEHVVEGLDGTPQPKMTGCHQPIEKIRGTEVPVAWFAQGLRIIDIANPHAPREVASYVPDVPSGSQRVSSNDVFVDEGGLIYLIDRIRGLHILERV